jgi:hypothetical protein
MAMKRLRSMLCPLMILVAGLLSACSKDYPAQLNLRYDFEDDAQGWLGGFADLPAERDPNLYELDWGHRPLPSGLPGHGIYLQGHNRSDDLFMYLQRPVEGLRPGGSYRVTYAIELASNVPGGMMGIGGSPGESVYVKVGASNVKPDAEPNATGLLEMNIDKGNQSQSGSDMVVIGDVTHPEVSGNGEFAIKSLSSEGFDLLATADKDGRLWLIVGTDSGFEGLTTLYWAEIAVDLSEIE